MTAIVLEGAEAEIAANKPIKMVEEFLEKLPEIDTRYEVSFIIINAGQ